MWSEFIVMMTNDKRRALHDFIAGTVVIQVRGKSKQADDDNPFFMDFAKEMKQMRRMKDPMKV